LISTLSSVRIVIIEINYEKIWDFQTPYLEKFFWGKLGILRRKKLGWILGVSSDKMIIIVEKL